MKKYGRLRELIRQKYGTYDAFIRDLGIGMTSFSNKINGISDWKLSEIEKMCKLLDLSIPSDLTYFFY